jgi:hypothetical protein
MNSSLENVVLDLAEHQRRTFWGKYRGIVKQVLDGDDLGKLVVQVPDVYDTEDSPKAVACIPFAGPGHGLLMLPEVGDGVWVEFESGNPSFPIWTGFWWADGDIPDPKGVHTRSLITSQNLKIVLDDDNKQLQISHPGGGEITMTDDGVTIKFGSQTIELKSDGIDLNGGALKVT